MSSQKLPDPEHFGAVPSLRLVSDPDSPPEAPGGPIPTAPDAEAVLSFDGQQGEPRSAVVLCPPTRQDFPPPPDALDFLPAPRKRLTAFQRWPARNFLLPALLFGLACLFVSLLSWSNLGVSFAVSRNSVFSGDEPWRLITALFDHANLGHLGSNMIPLLFFGWMLHAYFGMWAFPLVPLMIGVASNLATVAFYPPHVRLLGASGMIYGMYSLWLVLFLRHDKETNLAKRTMRAVGFALILLLPSQYEPNVSYLAHANGFVGGLVSGAAIAPLLSVRDPSPRLKPTFQRVLLRRAG